MIQKLKQLTLLLAIIGAFLVPFLSPPVTYAAEACPGSNAPAGYDCSSIPIGCPGSSKAGPIDASKSITCPYDATKAGACRVSSCTTATTTVDPAACAALNNKIIDPKDNKTNLCANLPAASGNCVNLSSCDLISTYVNPFINFLAALVGVAVTISIVIGGIQYGSSAGDPQKASAAKARIRNAIIALVTFLFLYALINFLVPGGLFNT